MQHKVKDVKVGDTVRLIAGGEWEEHMIGKVGQVIDIVGQKIHTNITDGVSRYQYYIDNNLYPFCLAPNGI